MASASKSQRRKGREDALASLNVAIDVVKVAKDISTIGPAQAIFGSVCALLNVIRETIANEQHYTELGLNSADISGALDQGTSGKKLDDLSQSVCEAVNQLTTTVAKIQKKVIKQSGRSQASRRLQAKSDKEQIAAWKEELNRILQVFNTELGLNNEATGSGTRDDDSKTKEEVAGQAQTRSATPTTTSGTQPLLNESRDQGKPTKRHDATAEENEEAERFCSLHPVEQSKLLQPDIVERLSREGSKSWGMKSPTSPRFKGRVKSGAGSGAGMTKVVTDEGCKDVCLFSDLPIMAGLYDIKRKRGVYYEVVIREMGGIVAIGSACLPYPDWRLPGWNRHSTGLHLNDFRKFLEDPTRGLDYKPNGLPNKISPGDSIGFGYEFATSSIFFTYNGTKLATAFVGVHVPRAKYDVYAAIGVQGRTEFEVNFGSDAFRWKEGNDSAWKVEGHVGNLTSSSGSGGK